MSEFAESGVPAPGTMHVDFEERVDFDRLRTYRLARARDALRSSELGALLCFDMNNIRYLTSTNIGEWARDKLMRFAVLAGDADPVLWDFGSAAKAHRLHSPWLRPEDSRAGMTGLRGSIAPDRRSSVSLNSARFWSSMSNCCSPASNRSRRSRSFCSTSLPPECVSSSRRTFR